MSNRRVVRYVALTVALAIAAGAGVLALSPSVDSTELRSAAFFAVIGLVALALAYQMPVGVSGNISFIPFLSAMAVAPGSALLLTVIFAVCASEASQKRELIKAIFNIAQYTFAISCALLVYLLSGGARIDPRQGSWFLGPFVLSYIVFLVVNTAAVSGVIATAQRRSLVPVWRQVAGGAVLYDLLAIPVVYGFAYVYVRTDARIAAAVAIPLFGLRQLYKTNYQLETINQELLTLIVSTVEARDPYTSGHSERVARYSDAICAIARLSARESREVSKAALLHDVGKIYEEFHPILRKPGKLTDDEYEVMKTHAARGAELVSTVSQFKVLAPLIRHHHEAWDGSGYPDKIAGSSIPLAARIIAIADTIDAMATDRPYRASLSSEVIRAELRRVSGLQFDPALIDQLTMDENWVAIARLISGGEAIGVVKLAGTPSSARSSLQAVGSNVRSSD